MSLRALQDYTRFAKYSLYLPEKQRRENWSEQVSDRVFGMHRQFYKDKLPDIADEIDFAEQMMLRKRVLGSQRILQFGGEPVLKHNFRAFNCAFSYCDRPRFFQEAMYALLCGAGVGFSVQRHHVAKLPLIQGPDKNDPTETYQVADSIEGWSDAVGRLIDTYMGSAPVVEFDFSLVRPEGAPLSSGAKAPGPAGLKRSLKKVEEILQAARGRKLEPIEAYDIVMHAADAVISGGVRRSATIAIFSPDDEEMAKAKTGDWQITNPQRGRSNNSALLLRNHTTYEQFSQLMEWVKEYGEPGFIWADSTEIGFNPCQPAWATVLTPNGLSTIGEIKAGDQIWSESGWTTVVKKWSTGVKPVFRYRTSAGVFYGTENHRVVDNGVKVEAQYAESIDQLTGPNQILSRNPQDIMDGLILGDGTVHKASNNLVHLLIGEDDGSYHNSEVAGLIHQYRPGLSKTAWEVDTTIQADELPLTYERRIPRRFFQSPERLAGLLKGLYSANGSIVAKRITLKSASPGLVEDVQVALSSLGIRSYHTTNKPTTIQFSNGEYTCRESYDVNITSDFDKFMDLIGFLQAHKIEKASQFYGGKRLLRKTSYEIRETTRVSEEEVFDITVDNNTHTYWTGGHNVSNCVEAALYPVDVTTGLTGWSCCNLCEINGRLCRTPEDFYEACRAGAIIGTLQAGYTVFPYMGEVTERIIRREALLGVSITGMQDQPDVLLNPEVLQKGAETVKQTNIELAAKLGINPAARCTNIKPAGSTSLLLATASGIHPHHARRYFRRVQANRQETPLQFFKQFNSRAVEASVWDPNDVTEVITFLCEVPSGARTKNQVDALTLLGQVLLVQQNWVVPGTNKERCLQPYLFHNVSNTINVKKDEFEAVTDYIYQNREWFAGISLIPQSGDKDYPQAPFCAVPFPQDMVGLYGPAALFASGVIEEGLKAFSGNLWEACSTLLGTGKPLPEIMVSHYVCSTCGVGQEVDQVTHSCRDPQIIPVVYGGAHPKHDWVAQATQFAERHFEGDLRKMTYCLKDIFNIHLWENLSREYQDVDWEQCVETRDDVNHSEEGACAGGSCEMPTEWLEAMAKLKEEDAKTT